MQMGRCKPLARGQSHAISLQDGPSLGQTSRKLSQQWQWQGGVRFHATECTCCGTLRRRKSSFVFAQVRGRLENGYRAGSVHRASPLSKVDLHTLGPPPKVRGATTGATPRSLSAKSNPGRLGVYRTRRNSSPLIVYLAGRKWSAVTQPPNT